MKAQSSPLPLVKLIEQFERLPGIGRKSAQRLAFHVLDLPADKAKEFAEAILDAHDKIKRCHLCQNLSEEELCPICAQEARDHTTICVVEDPRDILAFERTKEYNGVYHVLHGLIEPMDGVGPEQLYIKELVARTGDGVREVIMATNSTVGGEVTANYVAKILKPLGVKVTRIAYGIPVGQSNLDYADEVTLYRALEGRREL